MSALAFSVDVLTLFPSIIESYTRESILGRAQESELVRVQAYNIRDYAPGKHRVCDDSPYGGGAGMVMKVEPVTLAVEAAKARHPQAPVLLTSPRGRSFSQTDARAWATSYALTGMIFICGRYEGIDERILDQVDQEVSLGDFILTGGELAAMAMIDATARLIPGVLGNASSGLVETFEEGLLEHPQYTRPADFRGATVPLILQSGDHSRIRRWRRWQALRLTRSKRPDLFESLSLSDEDRTLLRTAEADL